MALLHPGPDLQAPPAPLPAQATSLTDRLVKRFLVREEAPRGTGAPAAAFPPRPTQLALPFGTPEREDAEQALPPLFGGTRRIASVLSYEQASLDQIIPDTATPGAPHDRLMLPGGLGLILHEGANGTLAFDWMHWGETGDAKRPDARLLEPTLSIGDLLKANRADRKLTKRRCIIPLTRYSMPVREGEVWAHRWISPGGDDRLSCAAGIWIGERGEHPCFAFVTGDGPSDGPMLLAENELMVWLRTPLKDVLARLAQPPCAA